METKWIKGIANPSSKLKRISKMPESYFPIRVQYLSEPYKNEIWEHITPFHIISGVEFIVIGTNVSMPSNEVSYRLE